MIHIKHTKDIVQLHTWIYYVIHVAGFIKNGWGFETNMSQQFS